MRAYFSGLFDIIFHQERMLQKIKHIIKLVIRAVNLVEAKCLSHCQFNSIFADVHDTHGLAIPHWSNIYKLRGPADAFLCDDTLTECGKTETIVEIVPIFSRHLSLFVKSLDDSLNANVFRISVYFFTQERNILEM